MTDLVTTAEVVARRLLPYSETTLRISRTTGILAGREPPPFIKMGVKVFYDTDDLEIWMSQFKKRCHTSGGDVNGGS